jgi:hypothetical protein
MNSTTLKNLYIFGILGLIGSIGVGLGEFLLHYSPNGIGYDGTNFEFFNQIPVHRLTVGHFVAVSFVPFYVAGYYHLYLVFKDKNPKSAMGIFALGVIAFMIGGMWISSRAQLGYLVHKIAEFPNDLALQDMIEVYKTHAEILVKSLRIWVAAISILFVIPIVKGQTIYPKWMAIFNPIVILLSVLVIYNLIPSVGYIIGPIAMNVVHFMVFGLSLIIIKSKSKENKK